MTGYSIVVRYPVDDCHPGIPPDNLKTPLRGVVDATDYLTVMSVAKAIP
jgi:hypothetical protein